MEEESHESRTIYCGNLSPKVTEDVLYELFLQAGPVERVKIPQNNGRNSSYGFVTYQHQCSVDYALEIYKDTELYGCLLNLKKRHVNENTNGNQVSLTNECNPLLMNNAMVQMTNMYNMVPMNQINPNDNMTNQNLMSMYQNMMHMYQNYNLQQKYEPPKYDSQQKYDRRSPPRRYHGNRNHPTGGRYDNRSNRRYDDRYDKNHDRRHDHDRHHDRKRYKR